MLQESKKARLLRWARANPRAAFKSGLAVFLQGTLGAALGAVLLFGPLNLSGSAWPAAGAVATGLAFGGVTLRQKILAVLGPPMAAQRWRRAVNRGSALLAASLALITLVQLYLAGLIPAPFLSRTAEFNRLWQALAMHYPYFEQKGIDWEAVRERYAPRVTAAASDDQAYFALVREMLAELNDAHTALVAPRPAERYLLGFAREIEGRAVVTWVRDDIAAPGLERGAVVLARDGLPVEKYLETLAPWLRSGSTRRQQRQNAFSALLSAATGETFTLEYLDPQDTRHEAVLTGAPPAAPASGSMLNGNETGPGGPIITGKRLGSGIGLIEIPTFGAGKGADLVAEFDAALEGLRGVPGLIIDLRQNGGGSTLISDQIAGRLLAEPFVYGQEYYTVPLPVRGWARTYRYRVKPRGETYTGPVALLTDVFTMSTAENFVVALKDAERAVLVGRPTAGSSGNPLYFTMRGGGARFSTGDFRRNDGTPLEGVGLQPHIPVELTRDGVIRGEDPDITAAENYLLTRSGDTARESKTLSDGEGR